MAAHLVDTKSVDAGDGTPQPPREGADALHEGRVSCENSGRIDQIVAADEDRDWHVQRAQMWRQWQRQGLWRCLFRADSGVTSVLERFGTATTSDQIALAVRTLSALQVPTRLPYITFDPLMTAQELVATHAFQARTDLLLRPLPELSVEQIVDGVRDDAFVAEHSTGQPFYQAVSSPLVSMQCLVGAAYTQHVHDAGLSGETHPATGGVQAGFADWRIGMCADTAQRWNNRNVALARALESLEPVVADHSRAVIRSARTKIQIAAHAVLTGMVDLLLDDTRAADLLATELTNLLNHHWALLRRQMGTAIQATVAVLPSEHAFFLLREYQKWGQRRTARSSTLSTLGSTR